MSDAEEAAITALREAARALVIGEAVAPAEKAIQHQTPDVALEAALVLDAITALLRRVDLQPVPPSSDGHTLHAVVQHLQVAAELARRVADRHNRHGPSASHPESGFSVE